MRPLVLAALLPLLAVGCAPDDNRTVAYQLASTYTAADTVQFDRMGTGQITFALKATADPDVLAVHVPKLRFADVDLSATLARTEMDAATWTLLQTLFAGTVDIGGTIYGDTKPTGSWSSATVILAGKSLRIGNSAIVERLSALQNKVEAKLPAA